MKKHYLPGLHVHKIYYSLIANDKSDQFRVDLCHQPMQNKTNKEIFDSLLLHLLSNPSIKTSDGVISGISNLLEEWRTFDVQ